MRGEEEVADKARRPPAGPTDKADTSSDASKRPVADRPASEVKTKRRRPA